MTSFSVFLIARMASIWTGRRASTASARELPGADESVGHRLRLGSKTKSLQITGSGDLGGSDGDSPLSFAEMSFRQSADGFCSSTWSSPTKTLDCVAWCKVVRRPHAMLAFAQVSLDPIFRKRSSGEIPVSEYSEDVLAKNVAIFRESESR